MIVKRYRLFDLFNWTAGAWRWMMKLAKILFCRSFISLHNMNTLICTNMWLASLQSSGFNLSYDMCSISMQWGFHKYFKQELRVKRWTQSSMQIVTMIKFDVNSKWSNLDKQLTSLKSQVVLFQWIWAPPCFDKHFN